MNKKRRLARSRARRKSISGCSDLIHKKTQPGNLSDTQSGCITSSSVPQAHVKQIHKTISGEICGLLVGCALLAPFLFSSLLVPFTFFYQMILAGFSPPGLSPFFFFLCRKLEGHSQSLRILDGWWEGDKSMTNWRAGTFFHPFVRFETSFLFFALSYFYLTMHTRKYKNHHSLH